MRVLLLNQCFYPDVMATAQQLTSLARGLKDRGHDVTVITSDRGYDDRAMRFPRRESWQGIDIIRLPSVHLGKGSRWRRALNFASFLLICAFRLLLLPRFDSVVTLTSPPLISLLGTLFVKVKGGRSFCWVMDLNPDEAIAAGWLRKDSWPARVLGSLLNYSLRHAERIIVLDRFMKQRIEAKGIGADRIEVLPPWALSDAIGYDEKGREDFRKRHDLTGSFVVMYSGNHSPCHPLDTLLTAAALLKSRDDISFYFVGGGSEQIKVARFAAEHDLSNIRCLPYQPLAELSGSLSAADLHVAVMGAPFVGIVHPCKVYNIVAIGAPLLYIGPPESSIADLAIQLASQHTIYQAGHGEAELVARQILTAAGARFTPQESRADLSAFSEATSLPRIIGILERGTEASRARVGLEVTQP
jgi:colanic acid biosynthesis glycosyl transferase WcaI